MSEESINEEKGEASKFNPIRQSSLEDDDNIRTPPRVMSSQSLVGEDIVGSAPQESLLRGFPDSDSQATTPPQATQSPFLPSLSPPPLSLPEPVFASEPDFLGQPALTTDQQIQSASFGQHQQPIPPNYPASTGGASNNHPATSSTGRRPPRIPHVTLPPQRAAAAAASANLESHSGHHPRNPSATDYSFLSALTESSSDASVPFEAGARPRRRTMSWDNAAAAPASPAAYSMSPTNRSTPANLLQPILFEDQQRTTSVPMTPPPRSISLTNPPDAGEVNYSYSNLSSSSSENNTSRNQLPMPSQRLVIPTRATVGTPPISQRTEAEPQTLNTPPESAASLIHQGVSLKQKSSSTEETSKTYSLAQVQDASGETDGLADVMETLDAGEAKPLDDPSAFIQFEGLDAYESTENAKDKSATLPTGHQHEELADLTKLLANTKAESSAAAVLQADSDQAQRGVLHRVTEGAGGRMVENASLIFAKASKVSKSANISHADIEAGKGSTDTHDSIDETERAGNAYNPKTVAKRAAERVIKAESALKGDIDYFLDFIEPRKATIKDLWMKGMGMVILPSLAIASFLYYVVDNPPTGILEENNSIQIKKVNPSASYWVIFLGCRQVITLLLAITLEIIFLDFLTLRTKWVTFFFGPHISLAIAQSKGWPFKVGMWGLLDIILLAGENRFSQHWAFWQDVIGLFNETNPSGELTGSKMYQNILFLMISFGAVETIKRAILGRVVGKGQVRK